MILDSINKYPCYVCCFMSVTPRKIPLHQNNMVEKLPIKKFGGKKSSRGKSFVWVAALGKALTMDNLRKKHLMAMDWCCICKKCGELSTIYRFIVLFSSFMAIFHIFRIWWVMTKLVVSYCQLGVVNWKATWM